VLREGGFPVLGERIGGTVLGGFIAVGGMASALGLFNAVLLSVSRVPEVMAEDKLLPALIGRMHPRWNTPWVSILICASVVSLMVMWTFTELIIIDVTLYGAGLFLEFASLVVLRITMPMRRRPFRIPLGVVPLIVMYLLPLLIYSIALGGALAEEGSGYSGAIFALGAVLSAELGWQIIQIWKKRD
jgi:amino acid transporter